MTRPVDDPHASLTDPGMDDTGVEDLPALDLGHLADETIDAEIDLGLGRRDDLIAGRCRVFDVARVERPKRPLELRVLAAKALEVHRLVLISPAQVVAERHLGGHVGFPGVVFRRQGEAL